MNTYTYETLDIGTAAEFEVTIEEKHMALFESLSGDCNPLHLEEDFAKSKGFNDRVVYGMLVASYYSTLAGVYLPGKNCLLHSVESKFIKPVFIGDVLKIRGEVTDKNDLFKQLTIKAQITNGKGQKVSKAVIKAGVLNG